MTDAEFAKKAAAGFNKELDVPFIPEGQELVWIEWAILRIAPIVPQSLRQLAIDASDGIQLNEIQRLEDTLVAYANEKIDIPYTPEFVEERFIRPVVSAVVSALATGVAL